MLLLREKSCLLLVDVQEKLTPKIVEYKKLIENCSWLLKLAERLNVPTIISEQYPKGLGHTLPILQESAPHAKKMEKVHFSCVGDTQCWQMIQSLSCEQILVIGIEAHVCVLETVLELREKQKEVFVVADAISSRNTFDTEMALQRMRAAGAHIVTKEMVFFEWVRQAGTPEFKALSQEFLR